ncbi:hypothetical protein [Bacillus sp. EB01]|uniref:hypothetical protein n=1 Tax=Bacillus sp. EB01 TaxID=1347086 RepID=UPI0005C4971B|nr:hypothetical protein [Bacillus sp. EB01]
MYRTKRRPALLLTIGVVFLMIVSCLLFIVFSPSHMAKRVVNEFYSYEQLGNFGDSWQLLHPFMKEKWPKSTYITDRSHVFMGHFGSETFEYSIEGGKKISGWSMSKDTPKFKKVYKFEVIQDYKGKYGTFAFVQDVYVVKNAEGEYEIVWDYKQ